MQKLLVVDENTTIQRVIKLAFKDEAIRVITVPRGRDTFEVIEADPPDIVLADSGREVAAYLKSRPTLSHIPVVLLKGAFDPSSEGADEALGCDDVLMKPLQPQTMIDRVKRLLRERKGGGRNGGPRPQPAPRAAPSAAGSAQQKATGPDLEIGQYFDHLRLAFSRTQNAPREPAGVEWLSAPAWGFSPPPRAEQQDAPAAGAQPGGAAQPASAVVTNELIEQVTQRVLDRLGDRVVRGTATELVSRLSKWLIVDELERTRKAK
jgi:DNA-binding response OmpR family regulator